MQTGLISKQKVGGAIGSSKRNRCTTAKTGSVKRQMTSEVDFRLAIEVGDVETVNENWDPASAFEHLPETRIEVSALVPGFYLRQAGTDAAHVRLLADAAGSAKLPPILVQRLGFRIIDGMHRVAAAKLRGERMISARVIECANEEALVLAVRSNSLHGLPLSKADRVSGAKRILVAHSDWSDRKVAAITGLSAKTIASLRNRSTGETQFYGKRLGRDGKRRPVTPTEGRIRAAEYINAHPEASLRQVARESDVSLGTVHDVRARIRRGTALLTEEQGGAPKSAEDSSTENGTEGPALPASPIHARAGRHNAQHLAWPTIAAKLAGDPALRYTEGGRAFLRWMAGHSIQPDEWLEFIDAIPVHWRREISLIADSMSQEWRQFAELLRGRQVTQ